MQNFEGQIRCIMGDLQVENSQKEHIKVMKNLKFGVDRAKIEQETATYKLEH